MLAWFLLIRKSLDIIVAAWIFLNYCVKQQRQIVVRCFISTPPMLQYLLIREICLLVTNNVPESLLNRIDNELGLIRNILHNVRVHVVGNKVDR